MTVPLVAPAGTVVVMLVSDQLPTVAKVPLKVTPPQPWSGPKFVPVMATDDPTAAHPGVSAETLGGGTTVKLSALLAVPPELVTTTFPLVAPAGTGARIDVGVQLITYGALTPLNFTDPMLPPRLEPLMVTRAPAAPKLGDRSVMAGTIVNKTPLLDTPLPAFTTTLPVAALLGTIAVILVSLQEFTVAARGPNFTVPVTWVAPKLDPPIVTVAPAAPLLELREVIVWQMP
jgi:hypothetical protein